MPPNDLIAWNVEYVEYVTEGSTTATYSTYSTFHAVIIGTLTPRKICPRNGSSLRDSSSEQ